MSKTTSAIVFIDKNKVDICDIALPNVGSDEIGVRTLYSGVSIGSELWVLTGKFLDTQYPCVAGYQKVGIVEEVGYAVNNYRLGDIIFLRSTKIASDIFSSWGGHTGYSVVSALAPYMFKLPRGLENHLAALLVLPAVGYHGVAEVMGVEKDQWVAVIGVGMIGQFSAQTAHLLGAKVIAIDLCDDRLLFAQNHANAPGINPSKTDVEAEILRHCRDGLDAIIDTSSNSDIINQSFHWLKNKGRYCFQGYYPEKTSLDLLQPHIKELVFYNPIDSTPEGAYACAQYLAAGKMEMESMVSCRTSLENAPGVYDRLIEEPNSEMSIIVEW